MACFLHWAAVALSFEVAKQAAEDIWREIAADVEIQNLIHVDASSFSCDLEHLLFY